MYSAMDIQFAYNLERLLYYMCGDAGDVRKIMHRVDDQFVFKQGACGATKQNSLILCSIPHFLSFFLFWHYSIILTFI